MSSVLKLGITASNNTLIKEVDSIEAIKDKGIVGDRHFRDYNDPYNQITLIESENINEYNAKYNLNIPYLYFRRNIVTKEIKLNDLIDKKINIGEVLLEGVDLCRPCKHIQEMLNRDDILKEFIRKGGLRCRILSSGKINSGNMIELQ
jgi:MOSC domain-containing protein YiiM